MAAFSPSPAPRHIGQSRNSPRGPTPPMGMMRRPRIGTKTPGPSRLATPGRQGDRLQNIRDDGSVVSGMDVDERSDVFEHGSKTDVVFAKSEQLQVTFYAHLPAEVKQILHNADFDREPYSGDVDTVTGFALVASANTCFVWKYTQALTGTPTCYIFECPQDASHLTMATPFHALVPYGPSREPGLILMTSTGQIRFWDGLGMGLAGGTNYSKSSLELGEDELVTTLTRADFQTYVVSTSAGRLYRLSLSTSGSKYHLVSRVFGRPQSSLSLTRFLPSLWSAETMQAVQGNIDAVALGNLSREASRRDLWVLIDFHIQRWSLSTEGWEALESQESILEIVLDAVRERFTSAARDNIELNLEFVDLKSTSSHRLILLVSYAGQEAEEEMALDVQPRRIYAIVQLSVLAGSFKVDSVKSVPYQSTSSSHAQMHPRLQLIMNGKIIGVQFGDTVTICSRDTEYMDRLELKSTSDRTFGLGVVEGESEILVLTAATLMRALIDEDAVANFDPEHGRANLIKSTMTQAILYGSHAENPLYFSFPPEIDAEALMSGAQQLSQAILESDNRVVRPNHDLQAQMAHRKERLSFLIKFINDNAVIAKMSQSSRQQLATDAEKLYTAHQLWLRHNERLSAGNAFTILPEAVYAYMRGEGEGHHEDFVRAFFRLKVDDIGSLLPNIISIVRSSARDPTRDALTTIPQANSIILTILQSAIDYRGYNSGVYGVEGPHLQPWTSTPTVLDIICELFDATTKLVEASSNDLQPSRRRTEAKGQLPELASVLFSAFQERLQWLGSGNVPDAPEAEREKEAQDHRFKHLRPEVLETLRRNGFSEQAFKLAEDFRDFRSLASLCHKDTVYPPQQNPNASRIQSYIGRFKDDFTTELYQWYIEHGELRVMFAQEHGDYLDKFFSRRPNPSISWIYDMEKGRFGSASESLLSEAETASELATKHLMLSIGKLSYLAQLHEKDPPQITESVLDAFHDGLDFVSVHETLLEDLKGALASVRSRQSPEMQVETIVKAKASGLNDRRALQNAFKQFVRRLLQGKALSVEDAADVLSLKDNTDTLDDYVTALHLLSFAKNLPDSRRLSAFKSVWRRIYIHDDWDSILKTSGVTDAELTERFRSTALHTVLQATVHKRHQPKGFILLPNEVSGVPSQSEIASRWPGLPSEEIAALTADYERESSTVADLELNDVCERVKELASDDIHFL